VIAIYNELRWYEYISKRVASEVDESVLKHVGDALGPIMLAGSSVRFEGITTKGDLEVSFSRLSAGVPEPMVLSLQRAIKAIATGEDW